VPDRMRGTLSALALSAGLLLGWAPAALAAERFAAPAGLGPEPCLQFAPCNLVTALNGAAGGDTVSLYPGSYGSATDRITANLGDGGDQLTIRGLTTGPGRPVLWMSNSGLGLTGTGTVLRDVRVENDAGIAIVNGNGLGSVTLERVFAHTTRAGSPACATTSTSTIANSVCWAQGSTGQQSEGLSVSAVGVRTLTLRNATLVGHIGLDVSAGSTPEAIVNATNVIAQGTITDVTTHADTVTFASSNYDTVEVGSGGAVTPPGTAGNQTAPPVFAGASGGDFRPAPGSPTIGAGTTADVNGLVDLDGNLRTLGGGTDIGAYEHVPGEPLAATGVASAITRTETTLAGTVNPNEQATTYVFEYGPSTAYGSSTAPAAAGAGPHEQAVGGSLAGLAPGTTYHYRIVATNASGSSQGEDRTFTTLAPEPPPLPPLPSPAECANGIDDDRDGFVDALDPQCARGRGVEAPADNPLLACSTQQIVLADVLPASRGRVQFFGVAEREFAGQTVTIHSGSRRVARARVRADGTFSTTAAGPRGRAARTARYQARLGTLRSLNLKLARRMLTTSAKLRSGEVVVAGRVTGRRPRTRPFVELYGRRKGCTTWIRLSRARLRADGTFKVSAPPFTDVDIAVYRARVRLSAGRETVTLPRVIQLR
jgi:hypothetical protein